MQAHPYRRHGIQFHVKGLLLFSGACLPVRLTEVEQKSPKSGGLHLYCSPGAHTGAITEAGQLIAWCSKLLHHAMPKDVL